MGALQYDSRDAVLGGLRRDYNLADYPAQENDLVVKMSVQPVVNIKDVIEIRKRINCEFLLGSSSIAFNIKDMFSNKNYQNWLFEIKNITTAMLVGSAVAYAVFIYEYNSPSIPISITCIPLKELSTTITSANNLSDICDTINYKQTVAVPVASEMPATKMWLFSNSSIATDKIRITFDVIMRPGRAQAIPKQD